MLLFRSAFTATVLLVAGIPFAAPLAFDYQICLETSECRGGQCDIAECTFLTDPEEMCFLNAGEVEAACGDRTCEKVRSNESEEKDRYQCTTAKARKLNSSEFRLQVTGGPAWEEVALEYDEENELEECVFDKIDGGSDETKTKDVDCFRVETCRTERGKCVKKNGTWKCSASSSALEEPATDEWPDPDFPCPGDDTDPCDCYEAEDEEE